jgi:hypothetical protein
MENELRVLRRLLENGVHYRVAFYGVFGDYPSKQWVKNIMIKYDDLVCSLGLEDSLIRIMFDLD